MPGTYVQLTQIVLVPAPFLIQALNDTPGATIVDPNVWSAVQAHVGTMIESRLGQRYAVPFTAPNIPPVVAEAGLVLAYEAIYQRRVAAEQNPWTDQATAMREKLDRIATAKEPLDPYINRADPSGNVIGSPAVSRPGGARLFF